MITFTIDNVEYQAEEGMTWQGWCGSEYNTDDYYVEGANVTKDGKWYVGDRNTPGIPVTYDEIIIDNNIYGNI